MSKCISSHGEFSEHDLNESGWCEFCGVFDMAAHDAEVAAKTLEDAAAAADAAFERKGVSALTRALIGGWLGVRAAGIREGA